MVILIAVTTSQITTTHGNQVREHRMAGGSQRPADKGKLPNFVLNEFRFSHYGDLENLEVETTEYEVEE